MRNSIENITTVSRKTNLQKGIEEIEDIMDKFEIICLRKNRALDSLKKFKQTANKQAAVQAQAAAALGAPAAASVASPFGAPAAAPAGASVASPFGAQAPAHHQSPEASAFVPAATTKAKAEAGQAGVTISPDTNPVQPPPGSEIGRAHV